ncbi:MAG: hypothetical protein AAF226_10070, partial [Verrucomicrobiota bacterium]
MKVLFGYAISACFSFLLGFPLEAQEGAIIPAGEEWEYQVSPKEHPKVISDVGFSAADWELGKAGFGYGDDDDATVVNIRKKATRLAIRQIFELPFESDRSKIALKVRYDDAFEIWVNGQHLKDVGLKRDSKGEVSEVSSHEAKKDKWDVIPLSRYAKVFQPDQNCIVL